MHALKACFLACGVDCAQSSQPLMVLGWGGEKRHFVALKIVQPGTTFHVTVLPLLTMTFVLQDGCSPLYAASCNGHLHIVKTLLEAGANINQATQVQ